MSTPSPESPTTPTRPPPPKHRKSLLQKFNKKHEALVSHMRAKRTAKETDQKDEPRSPSRSWKLSRRDSTMAPSITSISRSENELPEGGSRDYDVEKSLPPTPNTLQEGEELEQNFWYTGTREGSVYRGSASPLQTSSLCSRPEYTDVDSETSMLSGMEEREERWRNRPEDDVVYLERTLSVDSAKTKVDLHTSEEEVPRTDGEEAQPYERQAQENTRVIGTPSRGSEETTRVESEAAVDLSSDGRNTEFEPATADEQTDDTLVGLEVIPEIDDVQERVVENESPKILSLPDGVLERLALQLDTASTWDLRLSCKKLYDLLPRPAPIARLNNNREAFSPQANPPLSLPSAPYCPECADHHPWTRSDIYLDTSRTQRCRHYLFSARQPVSDIIGAGKFLCENCNIVRRDQKCRTCLKCEECGDLRRNWIIISWVEDECDSCVASHSPQWKHWKDEFDGRLNPGAHREWMGV